MRCPAIPDEQGLLILQTHTPPLIKQPFIFTLGKHQRWRLLSIYLTLTTAATGANRNIRLTILTGTTEIFNIYCKPTQPPSSARTYHFTYMTRDQATPISNNIYTPLPINLLIAPNHTIQIDGQNEVVNDRFTNITTLKEEWIDG